MITKIEFSSETLSALALPLSGTFADYTVGWPFQVRNIDGLGPERSNIATAPLATGRGVFYQGKSTASRNIIITLGFNPDWITQTISNLRQLLYTYLMPEQEIKLTIYSDDVPTVAIEGIIESLDPNIFAQDPEIQISIICPDPDFIEVEASIVETGVLPNSLTDGLPLEYVINYTGTVPAGFELRIDATEFKTSYSGRIVVVNHKNDIYEVFDIGAIDPVEVDEDYYLYLSTVKNKRIIESRHTVGSERINQLDKMVIISEWPEFKPGENMFSVGAEESGLVWNLQYYQRYGGL